MIWNFHGDKETIENNMVFRLFSAIFKDEFPKVHGVVYGTQLRRLVDVSYAQWGLLLRWKRSHRNTYTTKLVRLNKPLVFHNDFEDWTCVLGYSYDHVEDLQNMQWPEVDLDLTDMSNVPYVPEDNDPRDLPPPLKPQYDPFPRRPVPWTPDVDPDDNDMPEPDSSMEQSNDQPPQPPPQLKSRHQGTLTVRRCLAGRSGALISG